MSISNLSSAGLRQLISLVEKRDALTAELAKIEKALSEAVSGGSPAAAPKAKAVRKGRKARKVRAAKPAAASAAAPAKAPARPAKKGKRGALKASILEALKAAGPAGLGAKELSTKLGVKNQNIHVWFSTTGKAVKGLKKSKTGTWTYAG